jgi:ribose 5-phosphate isomerase B
MNSISDSEIKEIVQRVLQQSGQGSVPSPSTQTPSPSNPSAGAKVVAIGADHGGFEMKTALIETLKELKYEPLDCGTHSKDAVDYPDFALAVAEQVRSGRAWRGIMIDGAGIGSCMVANKVPGVRAAMAYDYASASNSREHNNANLLTLGAGLIGLNQAKLIVKTWLATEFAGGRHQPRVDKISQVEKKYSKEG